MSISRLEQYLEQSATQAPTHCALIDRGTSLTYEQLQQQVLRQAANLLAKGVLPGDRVGVYLDKSAEAVIALLAVLTVGAAYVSLDPQAPPARLSLIIDDSDLRVLVSNEKKLTRLAKYRENRLPSLLLADKEGGNNNFQAPKSLDGDALAYIIYTSGSTGKPKGVAIEHRAALSFVNWSRTTFALRPEDRVSSHAPFHFDLSIFDLYATIAAGATLVLVPSELNLFPTNLAEFIETQGITVWYSVPWILKQLTQRGLLETRDLGSLRQILFAGEVYPKQQLRELAQQLPHVALANLYGPTETNVCTWYPVTAKDLDEDTPLPIGKALPDAICSAVDDSGREVTDGEEGELVVAGPLSMREYWRDPSSTQAAFIELSGKKSYRTGDRVKRDGQGNWQYLGRRDSMIKRRGNRIELGEIENALQSEPHVAEGVVLALPRAEEQHLVAVCTPRQARVLTTNRIKQHLATRLPKYMMPDEIIVMTTLPKTSTGKIDRVGLRAHIADN